MAAETPVVLGVIVVEDLLRSIARVVRDEGMSAISPGLHCDDCLSADVETEAVGSAVCVGAAHEANGATASRALRVRPLSGAGQFGAITVRNPTPNNSEA